jgi:hypothetical protein
MSTSKLNSNKGLLLFYVFIALFYIISLLYSPVGYDESKYYIVSKYIDMGRVPWQDIHPGSVGVHFYQLYDLWFDFIGNSFYSARALSLVISVVSIASVLELFKLLRLHNYAIFAWILLYALNPFYGYLNVLVSHVSITNSLLIITASCQIQLMLYLKNNVKNNKMILIAIVAGISVASLVLIRPYYLLGALVLFAFLSYYAFSFKRYKAYIVFLFFSLLTLLASMYGQSTSEAKYNYLQSHSVEEQQPNSYKVDKIVNLKVINLKNIDSTGVAKIDKNSNEVQTNEKTNVKTNVKTNEKIKEKEEKIEMVVDLKLPSELAHRIDTASIMLNKAAQQIKGLLNPEIINPLFHQLAGYMINPLFIFYLFGVASIPFLLRKGYKIEGLQTVKIIIVISTTVLLPLIILRYSVNTSFTYLVHGVSLISLIPAITLSSILKKAKSNTKILEKLVLGIIVIITVQSHIFHTPTDPVQNPINKAIKDSYAQPGENVFSMEAAKNIAKIIDNNSLPGDKVLFDQYAPLVFSQAIAVPGLEMSLHDGFFDKEKWVNVETIYIHESNKVSRSAREVLGYIKNGDVSLIVTSGRTSKDLIELLDGEFCPIYIYGKYKIYKRCEPLYL